MPTPGWFCTRILQQYCSLSQSLPVSSCCQTSRERQDMIQPQLTTALWTVLRRRPGCLLRPPSASCARPSSLRRLSPSCARPSSLGRLSPSGARPSSLRRLSASCAGRPSSLGRRGGGDRSLEAERGRCRPPSRALIGGRAASLWAPRRSSSCMGPALPAWARLPPFWGQGCGGWGEKPVSALREDRWWPPPPAYASARACPPHVREQHANLSFVGGSSGHHGAAGSAEVVGGTTPRLCSLPLLGFHTSRSSCCVRGTAHVRQTNNKVHRGAAAAGVGR